MGDTACTYVESQVRALCHVQRTSCMVTQHAHRVVFKKNTSMCSKDKCNKTQTVQKAR